ncbi:MAG: GDP-mannose 4,6-dehydratase, partial [Candidatus Hinthialibacter sp.]
VREWLYVEDHCKALDAVLQKGRPGEIYNIGGYCEEKNRVIAETIVDLLKKPRELITYVDDRPGHDFRYSIDSSKIKSLDWQPQISLQEGLFKTVDWFKKNQKWWREIKKTDYKNYYKTQYGRRLTHAKAQ